MNKDKQIQKCELFRKLHTRPGLFVLANAWDVSSAVVFEKTGYEAIGTTSAGIAATFGHSDGENIGLSDHLNVVQRICTKANVPVNADVEAGYGYTVEEVAKTVEVFIDVGVAGINIEDENQGKDKDKRPLHDISFQVEKIQAIREFAKSKGIPIVINAKTDACWLSAGDSKADILDNAVKRAIAYRDAGADCVFVPGDLSADELRMLVNEIRHPINIVIKKNTPPINELDRIGVKRLSMGSGPMRAALGLTKKIALEIKEKGTYDNISNNEIPYNDVKLMF